MKRHLPWWVLLGLAIAIGVGGQLAAIKPAQQDVQTLRSRLSALQSLQAQAEAEVQADARISQGPLPISDAGLDRLWPQLAKDAQAHGYTVQLVSFTDGVSGSTRTVTVTVRLVGSYLGLDTTLAAIEKLMPLWSWRTLEVQSETGASVTAVASGTMPLTGAPRVGVGTGRQVQQRTPGGPTPPSVPAPTPQTPEGPRL